MSQPDVKTDHLRRLEASPLYREREIAGEQAKQLSRVKALWYLHPQYHEQFQRVEAK